MTKSTIDELLTQSAPPSGVDASDPRVRSMLRAVATESREAARAATRPAARSRRRLWWLAAPLVALPIITFASTAGTEPRLVPDFVIPVSYTTDTGNAVSCAIELFNGELDYVESSTAAVDYFRAQDWTGVGQRIYDSAIAYESDAAWLGSEMNSDGPGSEAIAWRAWLSAADDIIFDRLPEGTLTSGDGGYGIDQTCTGELH